MATKSLGRVSIVPQGDYDENHIYKRLDLVKYDGKTYLSIKEDNINPLSDADSWMLLTESGRFEDLTPQELETLLQPLNEAIEAANEATEAANEAAENAVTGSTSLGTITPSSTIPEEGNVWSFAGEGTYPNAGNITVEAGKFAILTRVDDVWSKVEVAFPQASNEILPHNPAQSYTDGEQFTYRNADGSLGYFSVLQGATLGVGETPETNPEKVEQIGEPKELKRIVGSGNLIDGEFLTDIDGWVSNGLANILWSSELGGSLSIEPTSPNGGAIYFKNFKKGVYKISFKVRKNTITSPTTPTIIFITLTNQTVFEVEDTTDLQYFESVINVNEDSPFIAISVTDESHVFVYDVELFNITYPDLSTKIIGIEAENEIGVKIKEVVKTTERFPNAYLPISQPVGRHYLPLEPNDFINSTLYSIGENHRILISGTFSEDAGCIFLDANKNKISNGYVSSSGIAILEDLELTTPRGTKFVLLSSYFGDWAKKASVKNITPENKKVTRELITSALPLFPSKSKVICVERPDFMTIELNGEIPDSIPEPRLDSLLRATFKNGERIIFTTGAQMVVQGHGSTAYPKKGYTIDLLNGNLEALSVKFGGMVEADSFHLKAFATDQTHVRDVGNGRFWRTLLEQLPYPYSEFRDVNSITSLTDKADYSYIDDAQYYTDGIPCKVILNDEFFGLFTLRLKKNRKNYALDNSKNSNIFLDSITYTAHLSEPFDHTDWEVKSPKISGYSEGGVITNSTVLNSITRLFDWFYGVQNGTIDMRTTYADYINLPHWLMYIIFAEVIAHRDTHANNLNLFTYDGTHWSIAPYDTDLTIGLNAWTAPPQVEDSISGAVVITQGIWEKFNANFTAEIQALYTEFRERKLIDVRSMMNIYRGIAKNIPREVYQSDYEKWGTIWNKKLSTRQIQFFLQHRIDWLDDFWLLP